MTPTDNKKSSPRSPTGTGKSSTSNIKQPSKRVEILPAAVNSLALNEFMGVKYGKPKARVWTAERLKGLFTIYLPDRTVCFGRGNSNTLGITTEEMDEYFMISPMSNPSMLKGIGYKYMMVTPERLSTSDYMRRNDEVKVFSDSGGFQMSKGVTEFVDPDFVAKFYSDRIDYGIGLDVPLPKHLQNTDWFTRMCDIQILNNKYIKERLKGSPCELYDVSHGLTLENRKRFTHRVLDNKVGIGLSLGGIGQANYDTLHTSTIMAIINMCYVLDASKGIYDRFHILGTTSPFMISAYNVLTEIGVAPLITADSSTYAQMGLAMHSRGTIYHNGASTVPGFALEDLPISYGLPCNCPVCALAGYPQVYRMSGPANGIHTLHTLYKMAEVVGEYTKLMLQGRPVMDQLLTLVAPNKSQFPVYRSLYKFMRDMDKGMGTAQRFSPALHAQVQGRRWTVRRSC
jgi:hypothetical protein